MVVGTDSMIGSALARTLRDAGVPCAGTTRRAVRSGQPDVFLDLADPAGAGTLPRTDVAVLCAGVSKLQDCTRDPAGSRAINVEGVARLAETLVHTGAFVVYLSTNQVFDGTQPRRSAEDAVCPVTEYGRQKADAEALVGALGDRAAIVRLTKVFGETVPLFEQWLRALANHVPIHPFSDMTMAPVPLETVVAALRLIGDAETPGVFQVSGEHDVTYAEAASVGADMIRADRGLIQPVSVASAGVLSEPSPAYTSLDVERVRRLFGVQPPGVWWTIEQAFRNARGVTGPVTTHRQ